MNRLAAIVALFSLAWDVSAAESQLCMGREGGKPAPVAKLVMPTSTVHKRDPDSYMSPGQLVGLLERDRRIAVIDIRSRAAFEKVRIAGSRNMPLAAVITKRYLTDRPVVLVGTGARYSHLEETVRALRAAEFDAHVLDGGIAYWSRAVPDHTVSDSAAPDLRHVPVGVAFSGRGTGLWQVVDYSTSGIAGDYFRRVVRKAPASTPSRIPDSIEQGKLLAHVLIIPPNKEPWSAFNALKNRAAKRSNIFVLEGGEAAVQEFVVHQRRLLTGKRALADVEGGCG